MANGESAFRSNKAPEPQTEGVLTQFRYNRSLTPDSVARHGQHSEHVILAAHSARRPSKCRFVMSMHGFTAQVSGDRGGRSLT
jgi:hypothetical protein